MSGFQRPPLVVPGRPSSEVAAEFPCPFCTGTAYAGDLELVAAAVGDSSAAIPAKLGVAHSRPSCETFKRLSADEFATACRERIRQ